MKGSTKTFDPISSDTIERYEHAVKCGFRSGAMALEFFNGRANLKIDKKVNDQDLVTKADRAIETFLREETLSRFPDDGFWGEELGSLQGKTGYTWIVDPIDGTSAFIFGLSDWCVSICLMFNDETVASAIYLPCHDQMFQALKGGGSFLNGTRLSIDASRSIGSGFVAVDANDRSPAFAVSSFIERLLGAGGMFYRNGVAASSICFVADGRLNGFYGYHINAWDCLGALLIVKEAGGETRAFTGGGDLSRGDTVLVGAPGVWAELIKISDGLIIRY